MRSALLRQLVLCLPLFLASGVSWADCECLWRGSFSKVQLDADLIISGTVSIGKGNSIDISVERLLRGEAQSDNIRVWLQARDYCRPPAELFPQGSQWVMALQEITQEFPGGFNPMTPNISYGRVGDYSLSSCGGYWLNLSGNRVSGNLVNAPRWVREPKMTPVLLDVLAAYVSGDLDITALVEASQEDPALRELMLDTRSFLRNGN